MNIDILEMGKVGIGATTDDEWLDAFERLYADRDKASAMGREGRRIAHERFGREVIGGQLAALFKEVTH